MGHSHMQMGWGTGWVDPQLRVGFPQGLPCRLSIPRDESNAGESAQRNSLKEPEGAHHWGFPPRLSHPSSQRGKLLGEPAASSSRSAGFFSLRGAANPSPIPKCGALGLHLLACI